jgi:hypothetical protein
MKNVFFAIAFMLVGTFAFANNSVETELNLEKTIEISNSMELASFDFSSYENYTVIDSSNLALGCLLTITVEYEDGTSDEFYIHVVDMSCKEFFDWLEE